MNFDLLISNAIILSTHNNYEPFVGSVGVNAENITHVSSCHVDKANATKHIDATGRILMAGLVNGHCHGDMTLGRGLGDDLTLLEQIEKFNDSNWFYSMITDEDRYYSRQLTYCEALLSGTTFISENMYWGLGLDSIKAMKEIGIRGALVEDIRVDFANPYKFMSSEYMELYKSECIKNNIIPIVGSIAEEDYEVDYMKTIKAKLLEYDCYYTSHLAENDWRMKIVAKKFGTTPIDFLNKQNMLGPKFIGSHVVYASDNDIDLLVSTKTSVVNTPLCEMKIVDGVAPIPKMVERGVTVCLGSDGSMWNNSNDIFREMKGMSLLHSLTSGIRALSKKDILDMATINGARVFGLENEYGSIEEGKKADFILVDCSTPHMQPLRFGKHENIASSIVFNATGQDVTDVFINGKHVVQNKKIMNVDVDFIIEKVRLASDKLANVL